MTRTPQDGFTLLELVVAVAVFAVVGSLAYAALYAVLDARERTDTLAQQMRECQLALTLLGSDLEQAVMRPYRDGFGDPQPPLQYDPQAEEPRLTLVRPGDSATAGQPLQRVGYEVRDGTLYRLTWPVLDGATDETAIRMPLLEVNEAADTPWEIAFVTGHPQADPQRNARWPPDDRARGDTIMPAAVEVTLSVPELGPITRFYALGNAN